MKNKIYDMTPTEIAMRISENQIKQVDEYAIKNRGFITASKAKIFKVSPEDYFLKYIMEEPGKRAEKKCFTIGTAVDDYISYGEKAFKKKYFVPAGKMLKANWVEECLNIGLEELMEVSDVTISNEGDIEEKRKELNKLKADDLKAIATAGKIVLTDTDAKNVMGMIDEYKRQPLFNYNAAYEAQKKLEFDYQGLKLMATLDRFTDVPLLPGGKNGEIRDMKTCADISKFNFKVGDFGYDFSMSFYNILGTLIYDKHFEVILDVVQSSFPYPSQSIIMPAETIVKQGKEQIIPVLNKLAEITKKWEETKDPKVWLEDPKDGEISREQLFGCEMYGQMDTTIQKDFTYLQ